MAQNSLVIYCPYIALRTVHTVSTQQEHFDNAVDALTYSQKDGCSVNHIKFFGVQCRITRVCVEAGYAYSRSQHSVSELL
jgi:hypothetical protein